MPDMPQGGAPAPSGGAPAGAAPGGAPGGQPQGAAPGGGMGEAIVQVDATLNKITQTVAQSQLPAEVKSGFQAALTAFRGASQALVKAAGGQPLGGGQEPDGDEGGGAVTPQQGGSGGAMPMSHQNMRG